MRTLGDVLILLGAVYVAGRILDYVDQLRGEGTAGGPCEGRACLEGRLDALELAVFPPVVGPVEDVDLDAYQEGTPLPLPKRKGRATSPGLT